MNQLTFNPMISGTERRVGQLFESEAPSVSTIAADVVMWLQVSSLHIAWINCECSLRCWHHYVCNGSTTMNTIVYWVKCCWLCWMWSRLFSHPVTNTREEIYILYKSRIYLNTCRAYTNHNNKWYFEMCKSKYYLLSEKLNWRTFLVSLGKKRYGIQGVRLLIA